MNLFNQLILSVIAFDVLAMFIIYKVVSYLRRTKKKR